MNHLRKLVFFTFFFLLSFQTTCVAGVGFNVYSPLDDEQYMVAPPLKIHVPERVDIQYLVNVCHAPIEKKQCEQYERLITGANLQCENEETSCRYEGGFDIPMTANRHYMLIVRPLPLHYAPIIIEFDFPGISKSPEVRKRVKVKE